MTDKNLINDLDDPVICRAIVLSLRMYMANHVATMEHNVSRNDMNAIAWAEAESTRALIEMAELNP